VDSRPYPSPKLSRLLVTADAGIDPHLLVKLCCELSGRDPISVSLLVPANGVPAAWPESTLRAGRLLRTAAALLDGAGIRVEDLIMPGGGGQEVDRLLRSGGFDALLVCAGEPTMSSPVLPLAARLARLHGLRVLGDRQQPAGHASWLRRVVDPLLHWPRRWERAA
jgi:hypothetical protein